MAVIVLIQNLPNNVLNIPCYPELREDYLEKLCLKINNYFINEN